MVDCVTAGDRFIEQIGSKSAVKDCESATFYYSIYYSVVMHIRGLHPRVDPLWEDFRVSPALDRLQPNLEGK